MRLLFFDEFRLGVLRDEEVVDVSGVVAGVPQAHPQDVIRHVIENWDQLRGALEDEAGRGPGIPIGSVRIRPPLPRPTNVDCMAVNYMENGTLPQAPPINAFTKSPNAIIGDGDTMELPDIAATIFEGEAELAVVIGRRGTAIPGSEAMDYVFGYTNFIDGSARGLPRVPNSFYPMKSRDTFAPMGPFLVTADEVPDPQHLPVRLWNNGELMQDFDTSDMAHDIVRCIEYVSATHTVEPGDVIATGTNHRGLHAFMDGDRVEMETGDLGRLHIVVRDRLERTWARQTRLARQQAGEPGATTPQLTGKYTPEPAQATSGA